MKISLAFVQRYLISYSASCTGLPGRLPRTARNNGEKSRCQPDQSRILIAIRCKTQIGVPIPTIKTVDRWLGRYRAAQPMVREESQTSDSWCPVPMSRLAHQPVAASERPPTIMGPAIAFHRYTLACRQAWKGKKLVC